MKKRNKYLILVLSIVSISFAIFMIVFTSRSPPVPEITFPPPSSPYPHFVAGVGLIEAASENINIAAPFFETVSDVYVTAGDKIKKGDVLFQLNTETLQKSLEEARANLEVAISNYHMLLEKPRKEEVPPLIAETKRSENVYKDEKLRYELFESVKDKNALSLDELHQRYYAKKIAKAQYDKTQKDLELLEAGAWEEEIKVAQKQIEEAEAKVQYAVTQIQRATVTAPIAGEVMKVNVRVGQGSDPTGRNFPLILFGNFDTYNLRIDIDEDDAWRFEKDAKATAFVRGNSQLKVELQYVRTEPYVIPKQSFTGDPTERVDTRVLQVIYSFQKKDMPVYAGQIMDVFIEAKPYPLNENHEKK